MLVKSTDFKTLVVPCPKCAEVHSGKVHGSYSVADEDGVPAGREFYLASCPGCGSPFLIYVDWSWVGDNMYATEAQVVLYPDSGDQFPESVPANIAKSYGGAAKTLLAGVPPATAVMCRSTLESICQHFGATGKNLPSMLEKLQAMGKLSPHLFAWANDALRPLGNDGAHGVTEVGHDDARDALEFTKALIQHVFVLEQAFEEFKARRAARKELEKNVKTVLTYAPTDGKKP